jgi:hypothetical protein
MIILGILDFSFKIFLIKIFLKILIFLKISKFLKNVAAQNFLLKILKLYHNFGSHKENLKHKILKVMPIIS